MGQVSQIWFLLHISEQFHNISVILWVQSYNFYRFESLNHSSELGHIRFGVIKMANVEMKDAYIEENESNHVIFVPDVNHNIPVIKFLPRIDFWRAL